MSLGLMLFELGLTRVLSVIFYYHTAFLAISIAMLGLGAGGLWVHLFPRFFRRRLPALLAATTLSMAALPPLFPLIQIRTEELDHLLGTPFVTAFGITIVAGLLPFLGGGAILALTFQAGRDRVARLYAADLIGAAVGALLLIPVMAALGGPGALLLCGALVAAAGVLLARRHRALLLLPLVIMLTMTGLQIGKGVFSLPVTLNTSEMVDGQEPEILFEKWNAFSRVVALEQRGWERGLSEAMARSLGDDLPRQIEALIDINAYAPLLQFDGDLAKIDYLGAAVSNLGYRLLPKNSAVAIMGPGCGKDVLGALLFEPRRILGIEINPILVEDVVRTRFRDLAGDVYDRPPVEIRVGDARTELRDIEESFDILIANSVATWAAHSAGAMNLAEQTLFTTEAFTLYRDRLDPDGILSISLWDEAGHSLPLRMVTTWQNAEGDVPDLARRVAVIGNRWGAGQWFTNILITKAPFTDDQVNTLKWLTGAFDFDPIYIPGEPAFAGSPFPAWFEAPESFARNYAYDISPSTDDRPFIFYTLRLRDALHFWDASLRSDNAAYMSLVVSLLLLAALVAALLLLPLWWTRRIRGDRSGLSGRELLYFAALGAGFMLVEIALIQRLTLFLGHPTWSLIAVLFGLLTWCGLGSRLADTWVRRPDAAVWLRRALLALILLLAAGWLGLPHVVPGALATAPTPVRLGMVLAALAPLGLLMGMPLAAALHAVGQRPAAPIPWAWGANGTTGVLASVTAIFLGILFGYTVAFFTGVAFYLLAMIAWPSGTAQRAPSR